MSRVIVRVPVKENNAAVITPIDIGRGGADLFWVPHDLFNSKLPQFLLSINKQG
jgi:hypothetical protein